jgi:hypothetical protein
MFEVQSYLVAVLTVVQHRFEMKNVAQEGLLDILHKFTAQKHVFDYLVVEVLVANLMRKLF